jgi:3-isopropylmalate dehydrogenase
MTPRKKRYNVACLAGDGIGPELMAEASRALAEVSHLHGFAIDEVHVPFGGDAVRRSGHPLPAETRAACRRADAVFVATTKEPALEGVKADLDLTRRVMRVRWVGEGDLFVVSPLVEGAEERAVERAFELACARRGRVACVGSGGRWFEQFRRVAGRFDGVGVEELSFETAVPVVLHEPGRFDVVATEAVFAEALSNTAAYAHGGTRMVASGRLSDSGPGLFGPTHGSAAEIAGQGVANPSAMLLAAALMLGEGLGERTAAETLEAAVRGTLEEGVRTPDLVGSGAGATTREFMDVLLAALPFVRRDAEFVGALS